MGLRDWLRPPRYALPLFLAVTVGSAASLIWLGWRMLVLDQALAQQQVRDRLEYAADSIAAALARELDGISDRLPALLASPEPSLSKNGALVVALTSTGVEAHHGAPLLYVPFPYGGSEPPASTWLPGELYEFRDQDYARAAAAFRALAGSDEPRSRAGALVRLARNLRKARKLDQALEAYAELVDLGDTSVGDEPAALVARQARCRLLRQLGRPAESRAEASAVLSDLGRGRWRVDRATFLFHEEQAEQCAGPDVRADRRDALALAAAVDILWRDWREIVRVRQSSRGRRTVWLDDRGVLLVWNASADRLLGFAAGGQYLVALGQRLWTDQRTSVSLVDGQGHRVLGPAASTTGLEAVRVGTETDLPWTLHVASTAPDSELAGLARRRQQLLASLGLVAFLILAGSYFVARAIQKELAVARLQSDFVSAVSHEFRTPLTSMRHLTELLKDGQVTSADRRQQYYDVLAREAERLHRFVETLLDFGRMNAGAAHYRFEQEEPASLVEAIVADFRSEPIGQGRRIHVTPNGGLPPAWIDREAFARALWNLLDNAAKYSPHDAPIDVGVTSEGRQIAVSVRDRGRGIPVAEHRRIFQRFVRGAAARELDVKGTGVGLAIVEHVVRAHGGDVRVSSDVGRGSTFTMLSPTAEKHA